MEALEQRLASSETTALSLARDLGRRPAQKATQVVENFAGEALKANPACEMFLAGPVLGGIRGEGAFFLNRLETELLRFRALFQTTQTVGASCRGLSRGPLKKDRSLRKGRRRPEGERKQGLSSIVESNEENKTKPHSKAFFVEQ